MIKNIVLASASPRRRELLEMLGCQVTVRPSDTPEDTVIANTPFELVTILAEQKAKAIDRRKDELVLGADTIVWIDGIVLGKPNNREDAKAMLSSLSGREHSVYTGFCLLQEEKELIGAEETKVRFRQLSPQAIDDYLDTGEPFDKAGAYGIQGKGSLLVEGISGDFYNVVGLPVSRIAKELEAWKSC